MPISLIAVQSVNGLITRNDEPGTSFASEADLAWFKEILMGHDLVLLGGSTYRAAREAIIRGAEEGTPRWVITRKPEDYAQDRIPGKLEFIRLDEAALFEAIIECGFENIALVGGSAISDWYQRTLPDRRAGHLFLRQAPCHPGTQYRSPPDLRIPAFRPDPPAPLPDPHRNLKQEGRNHPVPFHAK